MIGYGIDLQNEDAYMMKRFLLMLILLLVVGCGDSADYPHSNSAAEEMIGNVYGGTAYAFSGESRAFTLVLNENAQEELTFKLVLAYVNQSTAPTIRTGRWYSDGETLTLDIGEQDGEPTEQMPIVFAVDELILTAQEYDEERFDFRPFILDGSNVD